MSFERELSFLGWRRLIFKTVVFSQHILTWGREFFNHFRAIGARCTNWRFTWWRRKFSRQILVVWFRFNYALLSSSRILLLNFLLTFAFTARHIATSTRWFSFLRCRFASFAFHSTAAYWSLDNWNICTSNTPLAIIVVIIIVGIWIVINCQAFLEFRFKVLNGGLIWILNLKFELKITKSFSPSLPVWPISAYSRWCCGKSHKPPALALCPWRTERSQSIS